MLEQLHIDHLKNRGRTELRVSGVENIWRHLIKHLGGPHRDVMTLTPQDLEDYEGRRRKETRHEQATRGQTIRRERQALRRGLRLAKRDRLIARMPFDWDDLDPIESDDPKVSQEAKVRELTQINRVFAKLSRKAKTAGHEDMLRFILLTGLRMQEFRRCSKSWMHPAVRRNGVVAVLHVPADSSKTGDARVLPLIKEARVTLEAWGPQFAMMKFNHALKLASVAAKVAPALTPRDLRATYLDLAGKTDPVAAQKLGGHRNIATTGLYLDASTARAVAAGAHAATLAGGHSRGPQQQHRRRKAQ